jgi:hypothetical protein
VISTFTAFFDANVFYGARLRSLLLFLAQTKLFRARWSDRAHDEWIGNLLQNRPDLKPTDRNNDPIGITIQRGFCAHRPLHASPGTLERDAKNRFRLDCKSIQRD